MKKSDTAREVTDDFGNVVKEFYDAENKIWRNIKEADIGHIEDAVSWWNKTGRNYGAKSNEVREWMLDSKNYVYEYYKTNRKSWSSIIRRILTPLKIRINMSSKELNAEVQEIIDVYTVNARECFKNKDFDGFVKWQLEKWNTIPNPKEDWEESFRVAKVLITFYSKHNKNFEEANRWLLQLAFLDEKQQQHPGELSFMKGKVFFEENNYLEALNFFRNAYNESEGHCYGSGDDVYFDFYRNPEKYIKK